MNFFEKIIEKITQKSYADKVQIWLKADTVLIENLPGNQTLELSLEDLSAGMLADLADLLRPEDLAAISLLLKGSESAVVLAQADASIPAQVSNLQPLASIATGEVTVQRSGLTFILKVGDSVLAGDELNASSKPVTLQLNAKSSELGATVKFSGTVQFGYDNSNAVAGPKVLVSVIEGPVAVLGSNVAQQSVVLATPVGSLTATGAGTGYGVNVSPTGATTLVAAAGNQEVSFLSNTGLQSAITATNVGVMLGTLDANAPPLGAANDLSESKKAVSELMGGDGAGASTTVIGLEDGRASNFPSTSAANFESTSGHNFYLTSAPFSGKNAFSDPAGGFENTPVSPVNQSAYNANSLVPAVDLTSKSNIAPTPKIFIESVSPIFDEQVGFVTGRLSLSFISSMAATVTVRC